MAPPDQAERHGMLMVLMGPPAALEAEFHDWYDLEHIPERREIPGFHTGGRWICTIGWPDFMACYDLETLNVLDQDPYKAIGGSNSSAWSKRILSRVLGYQRMLLEQVSPGRMLTPDTSNGMALIRFTGHRSESLVRSLPSLGLDSACHARIFETRGGQEAETMVVVDAPAQDLIPTLSPAECRMAFNKDAERLLGFWRYTRYRRSKP
jgi:hypothetical protein